MPEVAAYVDGFNLYYGMKSRFGRRYMWLDVVELIRQLAPGDRRRGGSLLHRRSSRTNRGGGEPGRLPRRAAARGTALGSTSGWAGSSPTTIGRCKVCRQDFLCSCPTTYLSYEEKETDVALGVAMVEDAARGVGDVTLLVSADSDLMPAIESAQALDPMRRVIYVGAAAVACTAIARFRGRNLRCRAGAPSGATARRRDGSGTGWSASGRVEVVGRWRRPRGGDGGWRRGGA